MPEDGNVEVTGEYVWYCPWCEVAFRSEGDAYKHTYEHQDKGPNTVAVLDAFEKITLVEPRNDCNENTGTEQTGDTQ